MVIKLIDLFVHLAELNVQKYLASFPYWRQCMFGGRIGRKNVEVMPRESLAQN